MGQALERGKNMHKRVLIALALSLFVIPGAGHWYLGRRKAGGLFAAWATVALLYPLIGYVKALNDALREMAASPPELMGHAIMALHQAWTLERTSIMIGLISILVAWAVAAIDVLRKGS